MLSESLIDFFSDPASWQVIASGQAQGTLTPTVGPNGKSALQLDYDFHGGGGFVVARKEIQFALPETFEIHLSLRGEGLPNHFEFKVADPSGGNAWRYLQENFELPAAWAAYPICERDLPFAWGPAGGGAPHLVGSIELVIAAGPGGSGRVEFSEISLEDQTLTVPQAVSASSHLPSCVPGAVFELDSPSGWRAADDDAAPWWQVDLGRVTRFGGMIFSWPEALAERGFSVAISNEGESWQPIYQANRASGLRSYLSAPQAEARFMRLHFANAESAGLVAMQLRPDAFSHTPNEFIHAVAADFPRGHFPRYWSREQSYWTPIGSPEGRRRGLINEEGLVEVDEAGFSLEPFLLIAGRLITWADAAISLGMEQDGAPFPSVTWQVGEMKLHVRPWVDGTGDELVLRVSYQVENTASQDVRLVVAVRPYQVNPPWQAFRNLGGISPIHHIVCQPDGMTVEGRQVEPSHPAEAQGAAAFEEGGVVEFLVKGTLPTASTVEDSSGLASAAMAWQVPQDTGAFHVTLSIPFFLTAAKLADDGREKALARWREILAPVEWRVPASAQAAVQCFRTAASHILINRDGPACQPGPRRYTRSWVRDCVIMGAAMAKVGQLHVLRDFLTWYAPFQREDGFVPAVVDRDGVDWIVEHDSHGQFIWGICEVYRGDRNLDFIQSLWLPLSRAADYLCLLSSLEMCELDSQAKRVASCGLLPESASHEGYLAHPVHSYWDDFWGIRGLTAAAEIAEALGKTDEAKRWKNQARTFLTDVLGSIDQVISERQLGYIPGSVEWADFDPTATANAIAQLDFAGDLPAVPLHQMLETYLNGFREKHRGEIPWLNYTAYEIRIIGAFIRTGKRAEANELLDFFLTDRRPLEWNQWPEITWRDPRSPGHLGDVPHTWIAAEYMLVISQMIASEREASQQLVLASGLPWSWIHDDDGFSVRGLFTRYGQLDFKIFAPDKHCIRFEISSRLKLPPGSLTVVPPLLSGFHILTAMDSNGRPLPVTSTTVTVVHLPISATVFLGKSTQSTLA